MLTRSLARPLSEELGFHLPQRGGFTFAIAELVATAAAGSWWYDISDTSTVFQGPGQTNPVTTDGQTVVALADKSGSGNDATCTNCTYNTDGTYHWLTMTTGGQIVTPAITVGQNVVLALAIDLTSTECVIRGESGDNSSYFFAAQDASVSTAVQSNRISPLPTRFRADGANQTPTPATRDAAYEVLAANNVFVWEGFQYTVSFATNNTLLLAFNAAALEFTGRFYGGMELYRSTLSSADRAGVEAYLAGISGTTL